MHKDDFTYIEHILECIKKINAFCRGVDQVRFESDVLLQDAVIRNIEVIGEAAKKVSENFKEKTNQIPWRDMAAMRDKLIHDYLGVDVEIVWKTVAIDIPVLEKLLKDL